MRTKIVALLIVLLVISIMLTKLNLSAQEDSRSLSATIQFLKDNAESIYDLGIGKPHGRQWKLESPDDCALVWTTEASSEEMPPTGNNYIDNLRRDAASLPTSVTLSLSDINDMWTNSLPVENSNAPVGNSNMPVGNSNVRSPDYYDVYLSAGPNRNLVKWRGGDGDHDESGLTLKFKSSEMGERYMKALRNAVMLCAKPDKEESNNPNVQSNK